MIFEAQRLVEREVTLNQFIACSIDKCLSFFKVLRKVQYWDIECSQAFDKLKRYLTHPPLLSQVEQAKYFLVYLSVLKHKVLAILVWEKED